MPKIVDREQRRNALIEATWQIVLREGFDGVTLRRVAAEQGFSNGAIRHFFASKDELLTAAATRAGARVTERAIEAAQGLRGLDAIRAWCRELMPIDTDKRAEARLAVAFWDYVLDADVVFEDHAVQWETFLMEHIKEAREDGDITTSELDESILCVLVWMLYGLQPYVFVREDAATPTVQLEALEAYLRMLRS